MALAALDTGKRSPSLVIQDNLTYSFGGRTFGSAEGDRAGPKDMRLAIVTSSNVYFYSLANEMGVDLIHDQLEPFGFGRKTGIDLQGEVTGVCRPPSGSASLQAPEQRSGPRRDHLAGHRPGLQQLHHAAAGHGLLHHRVRRRASSRAWCARSRTWCITSSA
jgi:cell division protein FtsI/penicillin-binding protein 2